ncbi:MAG: diphosphomevalonate decarboxylase [Anaerolineae bacterium]|nr:MAG: diphosphomevalonate decarboxylase [Anaerolineae bacterium]
MKTSNSPSFSGTATAVACSNIAFIKYWGNRDAALRLPANGSLSMNLDSLTTRTTVRFDPRLEADVLILNGESAAEEARRRVSDFLEIVRRMAGMPTKARVESENNFPMGAGIASSASAFAALSLAASAAAGLLLDEAALSRLARRGSGSACRSVPGGFVEWQAGQGDEDSYARSIAPPEHWPLTDCVAIISRAHKQTGSSAGHALADTSPLHPARLRQADENLRRCRQAILRRDFEALAAVTELDCHLMHAVMMTSSPPLLYWQPGTLAVMQAVRAWRKEGLPVLYTIDAGANVHVICERAAEQQVAQRLRQIPQVRDVLVAHPGGAARLESAGESSGYNVNSQT